MHETFRNWTKEWLGVIALALTIVTTCTTGFMVYVYYQLDQRYPQKVELIKLEEKFEAQYVKQVEFAVNRALDEKHHDDDDLHMSKEAKFASFVSLPQYLRDREADDKKTDRILDELIRLNDKIDRLAH